MIKVSVQTSDSGTHSDVDEAELERIVEQLGESTEFVIVERSDRPNAIAQAAPAPKGDKFAVEYRDEPHRHFQTIVGSRGEVLEILHGWATDSDGWKESREWQELDFG